MARTITNTRDETIISLETIRASAIIPTMPFCLYKVEGVFALDSQAALYKQTLRKAFDQVDHSTLLHKLKLYHFSQITVSFFTWKQQVKVGYT